MFVLQQKLKEAEQKIKDSTKDKKTGAGASGKTPRDAKKKQKKETDVEEIERKRLELREAKKLEKQVGGGKENLLFTKLNVTVFNGGFRNDRKRRAKRKRKRGNDAKRSEALGDGEAFKGEEVVGDGHRRGKEASGRRGARRGGRTRSLVRVPQASARRERGATQGRTRTPQTGSHPEEVSDVTRVRRHNCDVMLYVVERRKGSGARRRNSERWRC